MKRQVARLAPFPFESDFAVPAAPEDPSGDIILTADELASLLAETRQSTADLVKDETLKVHSNRMQSLSDEMKSALSLVVDLAGHLETATLDEHDRQAALEKVRRLAGTLIEGQADLFKES